MRKFCAQNVCKLLLTGWVQPELSTGAGSTPARGAYNLAVTLRRINKLSGSLYHYPVTHFTLVNEWFSPLSTPPITTPILIKRIYS